MSPLLLTVIALVMAYAVALGVSSLLTQPGMRGVLDHPNERSLHDAPTPRTGGLGIIAGLFAGGLFYASTTPVDVSLPGVLVASAAAILVISLLDDVWQIAATVRILIHAGAAIFLLYFSTLTLQAIQLPWAVYPLLQGPALVVSVLLLVWFTNLYNFMDGIDGLAAGMGVIGFTTCAVLGLFALAPVFSVFALIIACACMGFLKVNFPPAKIFMGDVGSSVLGFLAAGFILWADQEVIFPLWIGILIFSPFAMDATVTLIRRLINKEAFWRAHRSHFYQRLVLQGWSHRRTTLCAYGLMVSCGFSAIVAVNSSSSIQIGIIIGWSLIYLSVMVGITRIEHIHRGTKANNETGTTA